MFGNDMLPMHIKQTNRIQVKQTKHTKHLGKALGGGIAMEVSSHLLLVVEDGNGLGILTLLVADSWISPSLN